jgi:hypothetical protein
MFQVCGVFAEFERGMICERVNAGLCAARTKGKRLGSVRIKPSVEERIRELRAEGMGILKIGGRSESGTFVVQRLAESQSYATSKATVYQYTVLDAKRIEPRKARRWSAREAIDLPTRSEIRRSGRTMPRPIGGRDGPPRRSVCQGGR